MSYTSSDLDLQSFKNPAKTVGGVVITKFCVGQTDAQE